MTVLNRNTGEKKTHLDIFVPIKEQTSDSAHLVKIDETVLKEMTEGDEKPQFLIVEVEEGKSGNNVTYDRPFFEDVAKQVNEKQPVAYLGHKHMQGLDKDDLLPDPQAVWLAANVSTENGKSIFRAKAYLLPESEGGKARAWLKRKAINSVSWAGDSVLTLGKDGSYRVKEFFLESIDFARKNKAGMRNQRLQVVTEMEGGSKEVTAEEIAALQLVELQTNNPGLVTTIKEMGKQEASAEVETAVKNKEEELAEKHKKEIEEHPEITMMQKVRELLGIKDDPDAKPEEVLANFMEQLDKLGMKVVKDWFNNEILAKKITDDKARSLVGRLIPLTEMEHDERLRTDAGRDKIKKDLEDRTDDLVDNDEEIQTIIKEMASTRGGARLGRKDERNQRDNDNDNSDIEKRGNIKVEKVRVS